MIGVEVNWLAIIVAAAVKFALGWGWYSPPVFGRQWMALTGISEAEMRSGPGVTALIAEAITDLIMAYVLARFVLHYGATSLLEGAVIGFMAWLGFVATVTLASVFYERRPSRLWVINNGYLLLSLVVMGAILGVWHGGAAVVAAPAA